MVMRYPLPLHASCCMRFMFWACMCICCSIMLCWNCMLCDCMVWMLSRNWTTTSAMRSGRLAGRSCSSGGTSSEVTVRANCILMPVPVGSGGGGSHLGGRMSGTVVLAEAPWNTFSSYHLSLYTQCTRTIECNVCPPFEEGPPVEEGY